jgi:outer membrane receptor protein involved in Fe transport
MPYLFLKQSLPCKKNCAFSSIFFNSNVLMKEYKVSLKLNFCTKKTISTLVQNTTKNCFMKSNYLNSASLFAATLLSVSVFAQTNTTISGSVRSSASSESIPAVSILVKGTGVGTFTDDRGNFKITSTKAFPVTLVFSSVGFANKEVVVSSASDDLVVQLEPTSALGQEVVVSATRTPQRILESPVSIERMSAANIANAAVPDFYEGMRNLKGVDLTTSSLTFKTLSTRGFNGSGNLRFNQLVDGMDNQAPGLNFSVGSIVGPTELDIDNIELLPGASSALYGSGGMNGTLLMTSKNPFKYQGLSIQVKQGVNHINDPLHGAAPYYDWALRYGKTIGQKFAFKISGQYIKAQDWQANDTSNLLRTNVFSKVKAGTRQTDPNYDGINVFGDEASASMNSVSQAAVALGTSGFVQAALGLPTAPTAAQIQAFAGSAAGGAALANFLSTNASTRPFYLGSRNNVFGGQFVSRTGFNESDLVNYNAYNLKLTGGVYYKIASNVEASLTGNWGTGTSVYTGSDRYSLKNLKIGQYKAEIKAPNWFLRAYTTQENSGDSYTATTAALFINRVWKTDQNWFAEYTGNYAGARLQGVPDAQAHALARAAADKGRLIPGTGAFNAAFDKATSTSIKDGGAKFDDRTNLYHAEGQYNFSNEIKFINVLVGASYRVYHLNSHGTIFVDTTGPINISEGGGYIQLQKSFLKNVLTLTGSLRYDKNENFKGRATPRATALVKVAQNNNIRLSYQSAYRFPTAQDQYINLAAGGGTRLIGGLPQFNTFFQFNTNPSYTAESIVAYRNSVATGANPALLKTAQFQTVKPETMRSYEAGYRGLVTSKLLVDVYGYYSQYKDFIGRVAVGRGTSGVAAQAPLDLASPFTTNNYSFVINTQNDVNAIGWGASLEYQAAKGYRATLNVSSDQLNNVPADYFTQFNTPKYRFNVGLGNNNVFKNIGFNIMYRWQDKVNWEGTFAAGEIPAFGTVDAQVSYGLPKVKSVIKIGGSNILNEYYYSGFGNPRIGGIYYLSLGYNIF